MKTVSLICCIIFFLCCFGLAVAQPFQWPEAYVPTVYEGGTINVARSRGFSTLNPIYYSSSDDNAFLGGTIGGPRLLYRDWLGNSSYRRENGNWNMFWASNIEEITPNQEYIITLREGWRWSDGEPMDVDDVMAAYILKADPEVEAAKPECTVVEGEPVEYTKISQYQYRIRLPKPIVNALDSSDCGSLPAHVFMPVYESKGAEGIKTLWGLDTDEEMIVSGGPYIAKELFAGERFVFERNLYYGEMVKAADGSALPGPEQLVIHLVEDSNAALALAITGKVDYYYPRDIDQLASIKAAILNGSITGEFYPNLGESKSVDFISYNFNHTNVCKAVMFRDTRFRQAISLLINREELVESALGGAGVPAKDLSTKAAFPFGAEFLGAFPFDPEKALELLADMGFTVEDDDGVLMNPETDCRVEFNLQFNSGNSRRNQEAVLISHMTRDYGIKVNVLEVPVEIWLDSMNGGSDYDITGKRMVDYDAQIWGLAGGDFDNPSFPRVLGLQVYLNAWNKSKIDIEPWEIQLDHLTKQMSQTIDLEDRINIYHQRAELMREYLPLTPLVATNFHFYTSLRNTWPAEAFNANSIEAPYRPGNFISLLMK